MQRTKLNIDKWYRAAEFAALAILVGMFSRDGLGTAAWPEDIFVSGRSEQLPGCRHAEQKRKGVARVPGSRTEKKSSLRGTRSRTFSTRADFVQRYLEMHRLVNEPDGTTVLYIGAKNWPTPIPLVHNAHGWYFDTEAGKREILYRRIGRNEMSAIRVCQELAAAEHEYHDAQQSRMRRPSSAMKGNITVFIGR